MVIPHLIAFAVIDNKGTIYATLMGPVMVSAPFKRYLDSLSTVSSASRVIILFLLSTLSRI
jgi:hypothetical protein